MKTKIKRAVRPIEFTHHRIELHAESPGCNARAMLKIYKPGSDELVARLDA